jgi:hypothetical protein
MRRRGIIRFWTENSVYEIDSSRSLMRRLAGTREPTTNQGTDRRWRAFDAMSPIRVGDPVLVTWDDHDDRVVRRTITSPVIGIAEDESGVPPAWVVDTLRRANVGSVDGVASS